MNPQESAALQSLLERAQSLALKKRVCTGMKTHIIALGFYPIDLFGIEKDKSTV
jgi:hypothetical protein